MLKQLSARILYSPPDHGTDRPILAAILGDRFTLIVDAGNSRSHAQGFLAQLDAQTGRIPDLAAITHWHWDHTFGMASLNAPTIGHVALRQNLARLKAQTWTDAALKARVATGEEILFCAQHLRLEYPDLTKVEIALPTITIDHTITIDLGGLTCELIPLPTDHSDDSLAVYVREEDTLFVGDAMGPNYYANPMTYTPELAMELTSALREINPRVYVESHAGPENTQAFWQENGIIEWTAQQMLAGIGNGRLLLQALEHETRRAATDDEREVIDQFVH